MPFYRFQIDVDAPPYVVAERLRSIVGDKPTLSESLGTMFRLDGPGGARFAGSVDGHSFKLENIGYRNSFLPMIRGQVESTSIGARVCVTMFIHPLVALLMTFFLGTAVVQLVSGGTASHSPRVLVGMFLFGVGLMVVAFFPEAMAEREPNFRYRNQRCSRYAGRDSER